MKLSISSPATDVMAVYLSTAYFHMHKQHNQNNGNSSLSLRRALRSAPTGLKVNAILENKQISLSSNENRRSANYAPSTWYHYFQKSLQTDLQDHGYEKTAHEIEEEVMFMINNENSDMLLGLELIDDVQRLGLGYRFEKTILKTLDRIIFWEGNDVEPEENKLHATALRFRHLRQHGYNVSQDVFKPFIDAEGNFMASLEKNVKGILSLYEASFYAFEGEDLMDKALSFSKTNLRQLKNEIKDQGIHEAIIHALELPLHQRILRLEARWQIEAYKKLENPNLLLLELAVLDFNMVQSVFQKDLQDLSRWWTEINLANKLDFIRDRLMECFFWSVGMFPEPKNSHCRKVITKITTFITTIDDIYDVYGTSEELELFTTAIERWDIDHISDLPDYMKLCFLALYNTVNEIAYNVLYEHGRNVIPSLKKTWADLVKAFLQEAKWSHNKYTPTFKEYIDNGLLSVSGLLILVHSYFLIDIKQSIINKESLQSLESYPNLLRWPTIIFRLCNDLATSEDEVERGETANVILCNMYENGISEELARENIKSIIAHTWKKMNEENQLYKRNQFSKAFVETSMNLARIAQCTYQYGDGHGAPDARAKKRVLSTIVEPVSLAGENK